MKVSSNSFDLPSFLTDSICLLNVQRHRCKIKTRFRLVLLFLGINSSINAQFIEQYQGPAGNNFRDIFCLDSTHCYAVGVDPGTVVKTIDGTNWQDAYGDLAVGIDFREIICFDSNTCITLGSSRLYKTTNGGINWVDITSPGSPSFALNFINDEIGFAYSVGSGFVKTIDGGLTWDSLQSTPSSVTSCHFANENFGYALAFTPLGPQNKIFKTIDGGDSWQLVFNDSILGYDFITMKVVNENVAFAVGTGGIIIKTENSGTTWTALNNPYYLSTKSFIDIDFIDEKRGYVVGNSEIIIKTTDGGQTWLNQSYPISSYLHVSIADSNNVYVAGANYIIKNSNAGLHLIVEDQYQNPIGKIYPNPANEQITLLCPGQKPNTTLLLKDLLGNELRSISVITDETTILREELPMGIYLFELKENGISISSGKIVFQ